MLYLRLKKPFILWEQMRSRELVLIRLLDPKAANAKGGIAFYPYFFGVIANVTA